MKAHEHEFEIAAMSRALEVSRSGYYSGAQAASGVRASENELLGIEIERIHRESRGHYGSPRVKMALDKEEGTSCGINRVAKIMREKGLQGVKQSRKRVVTTDSNHQHGASPNLIKRLEITGPNQVWVADITYIRTDHGWVYLAAVMDLYSRKIVGWDMADTLEAGVVLRALEQALATRDWNPGLIHHSDRGVQYACKEFRKLLEDNGIEQSMSAKGNCYDNATMESFFGTLKAEEVTSYPDWKSARSAIFDYLETYYNRTRIHTSLGGCSPDEFERQDEACGRPKPSALDEFSEASDAPLVVEASPQGATKQPSTSKEGTQTHPNVQAAEAIGHSFGKVRSAQEKNFLSGKQGPEQGVNQNCKGQAGPCSSYDHWSHHPEYPSEGCSPAAPSSVSTGQSNKDSQFDLEQLKKKT